MLGEPHEWRDRHAGISDTLYTATLAGLGTSCIVVRKEMRDEFGDQTKPQDQQWVAVSTNRKPMSCEKENKEKKCKNGKS